MVKMIIGILAAVVAGIVIISSKDSVFALSGNGKGGTPDLPGAGVEIGTGLTGLSLAQDPSDVEKAGRESERLVSEPERSTILAGKVEPTGFNIFQQQLAGQFRAEISPTFGEVIGTVTSPATATGLAAVTETGQVILGTSSAGTIVRSATGGAVFIPA